MNTQIVGRALKTFGFKVKKRSPEICIILGIGGTLFGAFKACQATLKIDEELAQPKKDIDKIHKAIEENTYGGQYTVEDSKKDLTKAYLKLGLKVAKLYAPAIAIEVVSITSILTSHKILRGRNVALAAAYTAIDKSFKDYRGHVVDRFGKDIDRDLLYNIKTEKVEETVVGKNGKEKTVSKTITTMDVPEHSMYAKMFCDGCRSWTKDPDANLMFLRSVETYCNHKLIADGYLCLNDVYEALGFEKTKAGMVVGWIYDKNATDSDNRVDFNIYDIANQRNGAFVNGWETNIVLDFNVQGNIFDQM